MAAIHGKGAQAYLNAVAVKTYLTKIAVGVDASVEEDTGIGPTGDFRTKTTGGIKDGSLSFSGVYAASAGSDTTFRAALGVSPGYWLVAPAGTGTVGSRAFIVDAIENDYSIATPVEGIVTLDGSAEPDGGVWLAYLLHGESAETATGDGTVYDLGANAPYSNGFAAALHVVAAGGTTPTCDVVIETATDSVFTVPIAVATFTQATGVTSEMLSGTTEIKRYIRATWTLGGTSPTFTIVTALAVK